MGPLHGVGACSVASVHHAPTLPPPTAPSALQLPLNNVVGAEGVEGLAAPAGFQEALVRENAMRPLVSQLHVELAMRHAQRAVPQAAQTRFQGCFDLRLGGAAWLLLLGTTTLPDSHLRAGVWAGPARGRPAHPPRQPRVTAGELAWACSHWLP